MLARDRRDGLSMPEFLDYPVRWRADWERLKAARLVVGDPTRPAIDWRAFRDRRVDAVNILVVRG